ncbi:hypothetical protein Hdeb2414_s0017g00512041 [Helianthus debilis subsp. tardiflorus]
MKLKVLFGSFTDYRDEKRITRTSNGSTGSTRREKTKAQSWRHRRQRRGGPLATPP